MEEAEKFEHIQIEKSRITKCSNLDQRSFSKGASHRPLQAGRLPKPKSVAEKKTLCKLAVISASRKEASSFNIISSQRECDSPLILRKLQRKKSFFV